MADKNEFGAEAQDETRNTLSFEERVIKKIAGLAASEIPGILAMSGSIISGITDKFTSGEDPTKGITVELGTDEASIDMRIVCEYGQNMPKIFQRIIDKVGAAVKEMTGLEVVELNVHVADVLLKEEFDRKKKVETSHELLLGDVPAE